MTKQSANRFGGGRRPDLRSSRGRRGIGILCLVVGLLASAVPAWAAEIVEVRVGRHPGFTRVVFELDRAAGYRIERSDPSKERAGLVVSLEASSIPRKIDSGKALIEQVSVEPMGARSVARVRLAKDGLRLKEMILTNPPRIVLDVLSDTPPEPVVAKATPTVAKPKAVAKPEPVVAETKPAPAPAPSPKQVTAPARKPAQQTAAATADRTGSAPARQTQKAAAAPTGRTEPTPRAEAPRDDTAGKAAGAALAEARALAADTTDDLEDSAEDLFQDDPQSEPSSALSAAEALARMGEPRDDMDEAGRTVPVQKVAKPQPAPKPVEKPGAKSTERPMMVAKSKSSDEGSGWLIWALAGVGAIVLVAGGLFVARRRSAAAEGYDDSSEASEDYYDDDDMAIAPAGENPFGGLAGDASGAGRRDQMLGGPSEVTVPPMMSDDGDTTIVSAMDDEEKESESVVFDDSAEGATVMDDMEVISRDQVNESLGGGMPPAMGAGIPEEFQQMMAEMSRRMEALESRCDELVDARDRLERQVAAQTEELRVQRAAIARTQRAVRNLGRPEGEEQEATEPALRDPNQPTS